MKYFVDGKVKKGFNTPQAGINYIKNARKYGGYVYEYDNNNGKIRMIILVCANGDIIDTTTNPEFKIESQWTETKNL